MQKQRWVAVVLLWIMILGVACAPKAASFGDRAVKMPAAIPPMEAAEGEKIELGVEFDVGRSAQAVAVGGDLTSRMIVRTVDMQLVVEDTERSLEELQAVASRFKGYIADSRKWYVDEQAYANITLRVPAESLDEVLRIIRQMAIRVDQENISGQDVTEEYTDLQARLRNLEATEQELLALLREVRENRGKAEEVLAVHRQITEIRGEIERLKGRSQYLERMSALATIHVGIQPRAAPRPVVTTAQWNPLVTASAALRAFVQLLQGLIDIGIYLIIFSPVVLVPVLVLWLLVRLLRRGKGKGKAVPTAAE